MANIRQKIIVDAQDNTTRGLRKAQDRLGKFDRFVQRVQTTLLGFVGLNIFTNLIGDIVRVSDVAVELNAKMALVTTSFEDQAKAQAELTRVSLKTGSSLESNTVLFTRIARPVRALGFALEDTIRLTELTAQGLRISGASQQESASVIRQLSQAYQSGVLRGEEFNALMENGGRLALGLADGLGVTTGELRKMSKQGELSTDIVINALLKQADAIDAENAKLPLTIGRAIENIRTQFLNFGKENVRFNSIIAESINLFSQNLDKVIGVGLALLNVALLKLTSTVVKNSIARTEAFLKAKREAAEAAVLARRELRLEQLKQLAISENAAKKAQAAVIEAQADQKRLASKQQVLIATVKQQTLEANAAKIAVTRARVEAQAANKRLVSAQLVGGETAKLKAQAAAATARLDVAIKKETASTELLNKSKQKLNLTSTKLTAALRAETAASKANTLANVQNKEATATLAGLNTKNTKGVGKLSGALSKLTGAFSGLNVKMVKSLFSFNSVMVVGGGILKFFGRLGSALLGLPGILLIAAISVANMFLDWTVALKAWQVEFEKFYLRITNPIDAFFGGGDLQAKLDAIDKDFQDFTDKRIEDQQREKRGFASAEEEKAKLREDARRQQIQNETALENAQKARAAVVKEIFDKELALQDKLAEQIKGRVENEVASVATAAALQKEALQSRITNAEDYAVQAKLIDEETAREQTRITLAGLDEQLANYREFYDDKISVSGIGINEVIKLEEQLGVKTKEILTEQRNVISASINTLVDQRNRYAANARRAEQSILDLQRDSAKNLRELLDDRTEATSEADKATQASIDLRQVEKDLMDVQHLDAVENADQIAKIQADAAKAVLKIGNAEKDRAKTLKAGSIEELDALSNRNQAAALYDKVIKDSIKSNKTFAEAQKKKAAETTSAIDKQREAFVAIQDEIKKVDANLAETRTVDVDLNTDVAFKQIAALDKQIDKLSRTIKLNVETSSTDKRQFGGRITGAPIKRAEGGFSNRTNGRIPGYGGGDKVKLLAEKGEFVVRKEAVNALGEGFLESINRGVVPAEPIKRRFGGSIDVDAIAQRTIDGYKRRYEEFKNQPARQGGLLDATSIDRERYKYIFANTYLPKIIELSENLKGLPDRAFRSARNKLDEATGTALSTPTKNTKSRVEGLLTDFVEIVNSNNDTNQITTGDLSLQSPSSNRGVLNKSNAEQHNARDKANNERRKRNIRGDDPFATGGVVTLKQNLKKASDKVSNVLAPLVEQTNKILNQSGGTTNFNSPKPVEVIDVNFDFNGNKATGQFENTDQARKLMQHLKNLGGSQ